METTRRTFLKILGAISLTAKGAFAFSRKKNEPKTFGPPPQGAPHKSVCYVYNAGMDLEGVWKYTFGQMNVVKGGVVTMITQGEEHMIHEPTFGAHWGNGHVIYEERHGLFARIFGLKPRRVAIGYQPSATEQAKAEGRFRKERIVLNNNRRLDYDKIPQGLADKYLANQALTDAEWDHINTAWYEEESFESRFVIVHPAREIADNLCVYSKNQLVVLPFWDDKRVDIDGVSQLVDCPTMSGRIKAAEGLARRNEVWATPLRRRMFDSLQKYQEFLRLRLEQSSGIQDVFTRRAKALLA